MFLKRPVLTTSFRKFLIKHKTFLGVMSKNNEKLLKFCREKNFKTVLWTGRINFDEHADIKTFDKKGEFFSGNFWKNRNCFQEENLPKYFFYGEVEWSFDKPADASFPGARVFSFKVPKCEKEEEFYKKISFLKSFSRQVERSFENSIGKSR